MKCVLFQCFFHCKKYIYYTNKNSKLKKRHFNLEETVVPHNEPSKGTVSPIAVLKLPKAYKKMSNYGRSYS